MIGPDDRVPAATLIAALANAAVVLDAHGRVLAWNAAAASTLGAAGCLVTGRTLAELGLASGRAATLLPLAEDAGDDAAAVVTWDDTGVSGDADIVLQKAGALARLAPGVAHDMRNHIGGFKAFGFLLRTEGTLSQADLDLLDKMDDGSERAQRLFEAFTLLARQREAKRVALSPVAAVEGAMALAAFQMLNVERTIDVPLDLPEVYADTLRLHQALVAIVVNELEALGIPEARGTLSVRGTAVPADRPRRVQLVFEDSAPVVPEAARATLFDQSPAPGASPRSGLDLAVARRLLETDGGSLHYEEGPEGTNRLVVRLRIDDDPEPLSAFETVSETGSETEPLPAHHMEAAPEIDAPAATAPAARATPGPEDRATSEGADPLTVLVCDDEESLRNLLPRMLERAGIRVLTAASGDEALALLAREPVDAIVSDHRMAGMTGVELHAEVARQYPHLGRRFVIMSGDPGEEDLARYVEAAGVRVLAKPFPVAGALASAIRQIATE